MLFPQQKHKVFKHKGLGSIVHMRKVLLVNPNVFVLLCLAHPRHDGRVHVLQRHPGAGHRHKRPGAGPAVPVLELLVVAHLLGVHRLRRIELLFARGEEEPDIVRREHAGHAGRRGGRRRRRGRRSRGRLAFVGEEERHDVVFAHLRGRGSVLGRRCCRCGRWRCRGLHKEKQNRNGWLVW